MREVGDQILFLHRLQPGGADRSYGIEVGKLAGLPAPVIARARTVLALLEGEAEHLVPALAPTSASGKRPGPAAAHVDQFALFMPAEQHAVVGRLRATDVNSLTPLAALQLLADLTEQVKE